MTTKNRVETGESTASRTVRIEGRNALAFVEMLGNRHIDEAEAFRRADEKLAEFARAAQQSAAEKAAARLCELEGEERRLRRSLRALGQNATAGLLKQLRDVLDERAQIIRALDIRKVVLS